MSEQEFSRTALTEEQTFGGRDRGGKTLPKSADRGFFASQLPEIAAMVSLPNEWNIACAKKPGPPFST
jgi:hypothetical protein